MIKTYQYRLYPNTGQEEKLSEMLWCFCRLYNACLEQRIDAYRKGNSLNYYDQAGELKMLRADDEQFKQFSHTAKQKVLRRLDKAFKAFFARIKRGDTPGFPRFKASARWDTAEFQYRDGLRIHGNRLRIVGIPSGIKVRWHRELPENGKIKSATVSRHGRIWQVNFAVELPDVLPAQFPDAKVVGIDLGLNNFVATSDGDLVPLPKFYQDAQKKLRVLQRSVARKKKSSHSRRKAFKRLAKHHRKVGNQRKHFAHTESRKLVYQYHGIVIEDLNIKGMARGMLAKSVNNAAWGTFVHCLTYKAEEAGRLIEKVNPAYTSQACSGCGSIVKKTLATRTHRCPDCGLVLNRDVNAAINVLHKSSLWLETSQGALTCGSSQSVVPKAVCFS